MDYRDLKYNNLLSKKVQTGEITPLNVDALIRSGTISLSKTTIDSFKDVKIGSRHITVEAGESIQNAINTIKNEGGGIVFLGNGEHLLTTNITLYSNIYLEGQNAESCILNFQSNSVGIVIEGSDGYNTGTVTISNGSTTVTGNGTTWTSGMVGQYILLGGLWYPITAFGSTTSITIGLAFAGIALSTATYTIATRIVDNKLSNFVIKNSAGSAIKAKYSNELVMHDIEIQSSLIGVDWDYVSNGEAKAFDLIACHTNYDFDEVHFTVMRDSGSIHTLSGNGLEITKCTSCVFSNIFILNSVGDGMQLTDCDDISLNGIVSNENGGEGLELVSGNTNIIMTAIGGDSNGGDGIKFTTTSDNCILGNSVFSNNGGWGINIAAASCDNNIIRNNIYDSNVSGDYTDSGTGTLTDSDFLVLSGAKVIQSADTERNKISDNTYTLVKAIEVVRSGVMDVYFEMKTTSGGTAYGRVYVNGVAVGTERSTTSLTYVAYNEDISVQVSDNVQLYYKVIFT